MKYKTGVIGGAFASFCLGVLAGAIWGGFCQMSPCSGGASSRPVSERVLGGAMLGAIFLGYPIGFLSLIPGAVLGAILTAIVRRRESKAWERHRQLEASQRLRY